MKKCKANSTIKLTCGSNDCEQCKWYRVSNKKEDTLGITLRSLLDGELGFNTSYSTRNSFIDMIEARIKQCDWISLSDGTTYTKTFTPTKKD